MPDLWKRVHLLLSKRGKGGGTGEDDTLLASSQGEVRVVIRRPHSFDEAEGIAALIKDGQAVVVNLEGLTLETAQRLVDYLCGATYALDGNLEKVGASIFLFTPPGVNIHVRDLLPGGLPSN